ncbi:hypothetical protein [Bradyrhizobium sp. RDM4]|uniref:hypothetical protein n=1 Tax=Bradyrhizobium sp. RDM4 TaxID=3378765 RepID=UPI0038FCE49D
MLHVVKTDKSTDEVERIAQALCELIESFDIETLIEDGETPRGYLIDPRKGILRQDAATYDAVAQLGITLLGRMLCDRGGTALMHRIRDQVVAQCVADVDGLRGSYGELIDGNEIRRWLAYLFKVCWKGIGD